MIYWTVDHPHGDLRFTPTDEWNGSKEVFELTINEYDDVNFEGCNNWCSVWLNIDGFIEAFAELSEYIKENRR